MLKRRVGPWLTIALVAVEVVLVWTDVLSPRRAVVVLVVVELLLALTALGRGIAAVRTFRAGRGDGLDPWAAAEDGLAALVPRRMARILLVEARLWVCLLRRLGRRRPAGHMFGYGASLRPLLRIVLVLVVFEGAATEAVLVAVLGHGSPWVWITVALHLYGLVWIGGFLASLSVLPHELGPTALVLRDSVFRSVTVPLAAISSVNSRVRSNTGRSGFVVEDGTALLAYNDATVRIALHPDGEVLVGRAPAALRRIDVTVDEPQAFGRAVDEARAPSTRSVD